MFKLYVVAKILLLLLESTSDYNLVVKYIFVQFHMAEQECMTLPTLPTPSNMHCTLKFPDLTVSYLNSYFYLNGKSM